MNKNGLGVLGFQPFIHRPSRHNANSCTYHLIINWLDFLHFISDPRQTGSYVIEKRVSPPGADQEEWTVVPLALSIMLGGMSGWRYRRLCAVMIETDLLLIREVFLNSLTLISRLILVGISGKVTANEEPVFNPMFEDDSLLIHLRVSCNLLMV